MFASQLLRILRTIPRDVKYETCAYAAAKDMIMAFESTEICHLNGSTMDKHWNPFLDDSSMDDQHWPSYDPISVENDPDSLPPDTSSKPRLEEFTPCNENKGLFSDKIVLESEPPEIIVRYKEINYHIVKDICVDEGMPLKDSPFIENSEHDQSGLSSSLDDTEGVNDFSQSPSESSFEEDTALKEDPIIDKTLPFQEFGTKPEQVPDQISSGKAVSRNLDASLPESGSKEDAQASSLYYNSQIERGSITFNFNSLIEVKNGVITENVKERSIDSENVIDHKDEDDDHISDARQVQFKGKDISVIEQTPKVEDNGFCDDFPAPSQAECAINDNMNEENGRNSISSDGEGQRSISSDGEGVEPCVCEHEHRNSVDDPVVRQVICEGESSFSAAGLITYTGPIAYSGSLSVRSDSSATSVGSFAFPILQPEWNSSPVRMTNEDGTHFRKHKGWRSGLLCCRF